MSQTDSPATLSGWIGHINPLTAGIAAVVVYVIGSLFYNAHFGPLSKFPGPPLRAWTKIPAILTLVKGNDNVDIPKLHAQYGPVVRLSPTELSLASGAEGWQQIYGFRKKGEPKPIKDERFYAKPFNGVHSVVGADDAGHSRMRKVLSNGFSDKALKEQTPLLKRWAGLMKEKLSERAASGEKADMLKYWNCTTFDIMGDLTFGESLNMVGLSPTMLRWSC